MGMWRHLCCQSVYLTTPTPRRTVVASDELTTVSMVTWPCRLSRWPPRLVWRLLTADAVFCTAVESHSPEMWRHLDHRHQVASFGTQLRPVVSPSAASLSLLPRAAVSISRTAGGPQYCPHCRAHHYRMSVTTPFPRGQVASSIVPRTAPSLASGAICDAAALRWGDEQFAAGAGAHLIGLGVDRAGRALRARRGDRQARQHHPRRLDPNLTENTGSGRGQT